MFRRQARDAALPGQPRIAVLWLAPVLAVIAIVVLGWISRPLYWSLVAEDRSVEWLTFAVYMATSALSVLVAVRLHRQGATTDACLYGLFALVAFFIAGEEISWGQRLFGFDGPSELVERNVQGEANLHNLTGPLGLHSAYIVVGLVGSFGARLLVPRIPHLRRRPWLYAPPWSLTTWFACAWAYYAYAQFVDPIAVAVLGPQVDVVRVLGPKLQEVVELAMAGGFLLFVLRIFRSDRPADLPPDVELPPEPRSVAYQSA